MKERKLLQSEFSGRAVFLYSIRFNLKDSEMIKALVGLQMEPFGCGYLVIKNGTDFRSLTASWGLKSYKRDPIGSRTIFLCHENPLVSLSIRKVDVLWAMLVSGRVS